MSERRHHEDDGGGERYLWDGSGAPDPFVAGLEQRLAVFRHRETPPQWPAAAPAAVATGSRRAGRMRRWPLAAALAAVVGVAGWLASHRGPAEDGWRATALAGSPSLSGAPLSPRGAVARPGATVVTGPGDRARLALPGVGEVELGPSTSVRLLASGGRERLALDRGTLLASITAPPRVVEVATPRATAIDLGCYFTLEVGPGGERLRVEAGWVALLAGGREAFVPGGAVVELPAGGALGAPVYLTAPRELRQALARFEGEADPAARAAALATVLRHARREDALTLWHLLARTGAAERQAVFDRLADLAPPPPGVTAASVGEAAVRDRWWEALGLGTAEWWRQWRIDPPAGATGSSGAAG